MRLYYRVLEDVQEKDMPAQFVRIAKEAAFMSDPAMHISGFEGRIHSIMAVLDINKSNPGPYRFHPKLQEAKVEEVIKLAHIHAVLGS